MLYKEATQEMINEWKRIYKEKRPYLMPNRKNGKDLVKYLKKHYLVVPIYRDEAKDIVVKNIMDNEELKRKLPQGVKPNPVTYYVGESRVFVGIDLVTGYFIVEGSENIYDELIAYRGLDEKDLDNFYIVAEYIQCMNKYTKMLSFPSVQ